MIQFIFLFPLIHMLVQKYAFKGVVICGVLNFIYEMTKNAYGVSEETYRLLLFRYLLLIAYGCYLASPNYKRHRSLAIISFLMGFIAIVLIQYVEIETFFVVYWKGTCVWTVLYLIPFARKLIINPAHFKPFEMIGKASYHVFLVQMVWFNYAAGIAYAFVENRALQMLMNLAVSFIVGIIFYQIETRITSSVTSRIKAKFLN